MPLNREMFKQALRENAASEFADIPEQDGDHTFSPAFEKRMERLMRDQRRPHHRRMRSGVIKALLAAAILLALCGTAFSIPQVREASTGFFVTTHPEYITLTPTGDMAAALDREMRLSSVPENYRLEEERIESHQITRTYRNDQGQSFNLKQQVFYTGSLSLDNEHGRIWNQQVGDVGVKFFDTMGCLDAFWIQDGYLMILQCSSEQGVDLAVQIIQSVEIE